MQEIMGFLVMVAVGLVDPILLVAYFSAWRCRRLWVALIIGVINGIASVAVICIMANRTPPDDVALSKVVAGIIAAAIAYGISNKVRMKASNTEDDRQSYILKNRKIDGRIGININKNKSSGWHRLFLCLAVAWLIGVSFLAVPEFKQFRGWGVNARCYQFAEDKMLDRVQERFPKFNRNAYVEHAKFPEGKNVSNPIFGSMPAIPAELWPQIVHDYNSIDFTDILNRMDECAKNDIDQAKSASLKRNIKVAIHYYWLLGLLPLLGIYFIGRFVVPWIIKGFQGEP